MGLQVSREGGEGFWSVAEPVPSPSWDFGGWGGVLGVFFGIGSGRGEGGGCVSPPGVAQPAWLSPAVPNTFQPQELWNSVPKFMTRAAGWDLGWMEGMGRG